MEPTTSGVLRLFRFHPVRIAFDAVLRLEVIPDLFSREGIIDVYVGRQGPGELGPRIVASIWDSEDAMRRTLGESLEESPFHPEHLVETADRSLEWLALAFGYRFDRAEPPGVLRLFEGTVRPGEIDDYVDEARTGTLADAAAGQGPIALYLAPRARDRFVTLSVWSDWTSLQSASGGTIDRPIATRHAERLTDWSVSHFEVLPNVTQPGRPAVSA